MSRKDENPTGGESVSPEEEARREQVNLWKTRLLFALGIVLGLLTAVMMRR